MKAIICKVLSVLIACGGVAISINGQSPFMLVASLFGGFISYELAVIIEKDKK